MREVEPSPGAELTAIARFRSLFEGNASAGVWIQREGCLPIFAPSEAVGDLISALYEHNFIVSFDWPAWLPHAQTYFDDHSMLLDASEDLVRRLFTVLVRQERFCEGTFAEAVEGGLVRDLLTRVAELAQESGKSRR